MQRDESKTTTKLINIEINKKRYQYREDMKLGEGAVGVVYKAWYYENPDNFVAIKIIKNIDESSLIEYQKEIDFMKKISNDSGISSDFFAKIIDTCIDTKKVRKNACSINLVDIYIVLEYCNLKDLNHYLTINKELPEEKAVDILSQIIYGLKILRRLKILHRDIKPSNILVHQKHDNTLQIKIIDFGCSKSLDKNESIYRNDMTSKKNSSLSDNHDKLQLMKTNVGTPLYMSPQLLEGKEYTDKSDIWSLGILYYNMLFAKTPWPCDTFEEYLLIINKKNKITFPKDVNHISDLSKKFIEECLEYDESKRMSWDQLFEHELIKRNFNAINKMIICQCINHILYFIQELYALWLKLLALISKIQHDIKFNFSIDELKEIIQKNGAFYNESVLSGYNSIKNQINKINIIFENKIEYNNNSDFQNLKKIGCRLDSELEGFNRFGIVYH